MHSAGVTNLDDTAGALAPDFYWSTKGAPPITQPRVAATLFRSSETAQIVVQTGKQGSSGTRASLRLYPKSTA